MANLTDWYNDVVPHAAGVVPDVALDAIRKAAIAFCASTLVWRYEHPPVDVVNGQALYPFVPPAGAVVVEVLSAWYDRVLLTVCGSDDLAEVNSGWLSWTGPRPIYLTQPDERNARLVPEPSVNLDDGLVMLVALKPTITATTIEDRIYEEYREEIACGALARLYESPRKPYSDAALARERKAEFRRYCNVVYNRAMQGFGRSYNHDIRVR